MPVETPTLYCDSTVTPAFNFRDDQLFKTDAQSLLKEIDDSVVLLPRTDDVVENVSDLILYEVQTQWELSVEERDVPLNCVDDLTAAEVYWARHGVVRSMFQDGYSRQQQFVDIVENATVDHVAMRRLDRAFKWDGPVQGIDDSSLNDDGYCTRWAMAATAEWGDLKGCERTYKRWLDQLPRIISLMDHRPLVRNGNHERAIKDSLSNIRSADTEEGNIWIWRNSLTEFQLTSRLPPDLEILKALAEYSSMQCCLPRNLCVLPSVTANFLELVVRQLSRIGGGVRGLIVDESCIEQLTDGSLDDTNIDWLILDPLTAKVRNIDSLPLEDVQRLHEACQQRNIALFCNKLGRKPTLGGRPLQFSNPHGLDWDEWPEAVRIREMPRHFYEFRSGAVG